MSLNETTVEAIALEMGDAPFGSNLKNTDYTDSGALVVQGKNIKGRVFDWSDKRHVSFDKYASIPRSHCFEGDLLFPKVGTIGKVGILSLCEGYDKYLLSTNTMRLKVDPEKADPYFIYYYFTWSKTVRLIQAMNSKSVQPVFNFTSLKKFPLMLPSLEIQRHASQVIKKLDDKIILNNQTNQTLEEMAQAIFKSWFVDFDPVKAKINGEQPEGMDAATASLFPEKLDSETSIPEGWTQGVISDIAKLNGKSWTKKKHPDEVHYVDLANTKNGVIESVTSYEFEDAPSRARRVLNPGDTIVGTVRPGNRSFAYIGQTEQPLTGSTGFAVLTPKEEFWSSLVYLATTNDDSIDEYARLADGGAYPAIKPAVVAETECVIPTEEIAKKFWEITGPMLKKAHQNRLENEDLAALRDTLLPKLLSGEIELETK
ncbi:restriction endonuclease subunit S [Vibrio paucivorans]|uniref:Restriction endonuclease subunit S n=1 Tax=Vibrio paucivorans TaxID=2829489 RepID=A0A9X3CGF7_9VIBR|nr:restriction endonuclease subunit S [Vibrio paucivorans]MCW8335316.1 restriction endonuclease subunit S [Vibrio paucivorans]